jgi:hypothetical protein
MPALALCPGCHSLEYVGVWFPKDELFCAACVGFIDNDIEVKYEFWTWHMNGPSPVVKHWNIGMREQPG